MVRIKPRGLLLVLAVPVVFLLGPLHWEPRPVVRPVQLPNKARPIVLAVPSHITAVGPKYQTQYPELILLSGRSVPQAKEETGAVWACPRAISICGQGDSWV